MLRVEGLWTEEQQRTQCSEALPVPSGQAAHPGGSEVKAQKQNA